MFPARITHAAVRTSRAHSFAISLHSLSAQAVCLCDINTDPPSSPGRTAWCAKFLYLGPKVNGPALRMTPAEHSIMDPKSSACLPACLPDYFKFHQQQHRFTFPLLCPWQDHLVRKSDKHLIPKVENTNIDRSVGIIHLTILGWVCKCGPFSVPPSTPTTASVSVPGCCHTEVNAVALLLMHCTPCLPAFVMGLNHR